eukprot:m.267468 g.267468  ORF g.267468 m.267468 type:complete len:194 (+) comp40514_c1_seq5:841-1422(+)
MGSIVGSSQYNAWQSHYCIYKRQVHYFVYLFEIAWSLEGLKNKLYVFLKGPGWAPGKPRLGVTTDIPDAKYPLPRYDSSLPNWATFCVFSHFLLTTAIYTTLGLKLTTLSSTAINLGVLSCVISLYCYGKLFDRKSYAAKLEFIRVLAFLLLDLYFSPLQSLLELSSTGIAAVRLWFAFSALVWLSLSLSLKQ